jgi:hypothetical protein
MNSRTSAALPLCALIAALLAGCGGGAPSMGSLWPFGGEGGRELSRIPPNSTPYRCDGGKRFYLRTLDNGAAVWVILPEREFRLDKAPGQRSGSRFGTGKAILEVSGDQVTLTDGPNTSYTGCRIPSAEPAKPVEKPAEKAADKPAAKPAEKP